jgi:hypothetical protein
MTCNASEVAVCCSSASERRLRASASSRVRPVELLLQIGCRGTATARSRRLFAAFDLHCLSVARLHSCTARRNAGLARGHTTTNAIDATNSHLLIKPSYDAQDHAKGNERYHTRADLERGLDQGQRTRARCPILHSRKSTHGSISSDAVRVGRRSQRVGAAVGR